MVLFMYIVKVRVTKVQSPLVLILAGACASRQMAFVFPRNVAAFGGRILAGRIWREKERAGTYSCSYSCSIAREPRARAPRVRGQLVGFGVEI
jgi:hypothetical protein